MRLAGDAWNRILMPLYDRALQTVLQTFDRSPPSFRLRQNAAKATCYMPREAIFGLLVLCRISCLRASQHQSAQSDSQG